MSIHHYVGGTVWTSGGTEVTVEFPTVPELTTAARGGEGGSGSVIVTDPTGTLDLRGWNRYRAEETACTTRPLIYPGFIKGKKVRRGAEGPRGVGRVWECELGDLNLLAHLVAFNTADANRPAETFAARMTWFLASSMVSGLFSDTGYVITGHDSVALDAADYRRRYPDDVTGDIASQTGWDWFIFWDYTAAAPSLFLNLRDAAILTSSLSISNFAGEANDTTIFSTGHSSETEDAVNERDPDETYSAVDLYWVGGETHRSSSAVASTYIARSFVYESTRIGRQATAEAVADQFMSDHSIEQDTLTIPVRLPKALVNMITAGERLAVHLEHLDFTSGTDYGGAGYVYVRVARRTVSQAELDFYDLTLTCTNFVGAAGGGGGGGGGTGGFPHPPPTPVPPPFDGCITYTGYPAAFPKSTTVTFYNGDVYSAAYTATQAPDDGASSFSTYWIRDSGVGLTVGAHGFGHPVGTASATETFTMSGVVAGGEPFVLSGFLSVDLGKSAAGAIACCTLTLVTPGPDNPNPATGPGTTEPPQPGQWVYGELVTLTAGAGTTEFAFADLSLHVRYDISDQTPAIVSYDGAAGTFVMPSQPPLGTQVFVDYQGR